MNENINKSLILIYEFIRDPFGKPINNINDDKSLVFIASILSCFTVIVRFLNTSMDHWVYIVYLFSGLLLSPLFGLLVVHFKGAIFSLYLRYIASPIFKVQLADFLKAKQIVTFTTIGLIVSSVPSLKYVGIVIGLIIEILGIYRLFKLDLLKSIIVGLIYNGFWLGLIFLIAKGTAWI